MKILIGILSLGLVIFIHELGHLIAALSCGVEVEAFSIGFGPVLLRKKYKQTEFRLSLLPLGGYCGMKGEHAFSTALANNQDEIPHEEHSFYSVHPFKRVIIAFAGPFANLLFAVLVFAIANAHGYSYQSYGNQIVPASLYEKNGTERGPADIAGLREGDTILSIDGKKISTYSDIQQNISTHPDTDLVMEVERDGTIEYIHITPALDKGTGTGRIGIYPYVPLVIGAVKPGSAAESAGLAPGDKIIAVDATPVSHYFQFASLLQKRPEQIHISVDRNGLSFERTLVLIYAKDEIPQTGIEWQTIPVDIPGTGFFVSIKNGFEETWHTMALTIKAIGLLFQGVDVTEAVSGPVRITMMIGEVAQTGMSSLAEIIGIICVSLFLMNLLPIPVLDGGLILFSIVEIIHRRPLRPKTLYYVQFIGIAFILGMFLLAMVGDIHYLTK